MSERKALKGLCGVRVWEIGSNSPAAYETGEMTALEGAQSLTKEVSRSDYTIYADDGVYDSGSDYQYTDLKLKVAQLPLAVEAMLAGGAYDETTQTYTFAANDMAPELALGFAALMLNGQYRMWVYYACKLMSVKADHSTRGDKNDVQAYELSFRATQRKTDGAIGVIRDGSGGDYAWLSSFGTQP